MTKPKHKCAYPWQQMIIDLTGEVVPCCFWSGYGNSGKPLGNTNEKSLAEIWNGEAYRDLRRNMASNDLAGHPCGNCMAYRWANEEFPRFSWPTGFTVETGFCYLAQISEKFLKEAGDDADSIVLYEDGKPLVFPGARHEDIRNLGAGRYAISNNWLYFSTSDNTDCVHNGRRYELRSGEATTGLGSLDRDSDSGRNLLAAYDEYLAGKVEMDAKPSMISLISTADCNIDCPACSQNTVRLTRVQHRPETVPDVLNHVRYLHQFIWQGGEPYLIKQFRQFINEFKRDDNPNLTFGFTSNGTMITSAEAEKLKRFPRINASVSIDSFNKENFERIRAGARFEQVTNNVLRLMAMHDAPDRVFSVGMIVCKSNMHELADNVRAAIDYELGINLSPVVVYPVTERLDVFAAFDAETKGWDEQIRQAADIVAKARAERRLAIRRIDPSAMIEEIARIHREASNRYSELVRMAINVRDPTDSLEGMRRPGVIVATATNIPICYVPFVGGAGRYELQIPAADVRKSAKLTAYYLHDLLEPMGFLAAQDFRVSGTPGPLAFTVPRFVPVVRPRNASYARYGDSTPEGLNVRTPQEIFEAYKRLTAREQHAGFRAKRSFSPAAVVERLRDGLRYRLRRRH